MKTFAWKDLNHKNSPEVRERIKQEAREELDRVGFSALRKARRMTQTDLAQKLDIDQASVSALEGRTDLLLSTLTKYVRALGGDVEIRAVFPDAAFNLASVFAEDTAKHATVSRKATTVAVPQKKKAQPKVQHAMVAAG